MNESKYSDTHRFGIHPNIAICFLLILVVAMAYLPVGEFDFNSYDDFLYVNDNPQVQSGFSLNTFLWSFTDATSVTNYWAPLTWISFLLDFELFGMNAGGYHLTNLLLHLINTVLLFFLLKDMTRNRWRSAFVALLFGIHPLHVESVAWVSERKDVLSTVFWMLTLWCYYRYVKNPKIVRYATFFICYVLGLMAKPMAITLPFLMLLLDYWPLYRTRFLRTADKIVKTKIHSVPFLLLEKMPLMLLSIIISIATFITQQEGGAVKSLSSIPLYIRVENVLVSYVHYIVKLFFPAKMAVVYPYPIDIPIWQVVGAGCLLIVVTILCFYYRKTHPYHIVGWLWYLGTMIPVIGLVVIGPHAMADRYTYVTTIGLLISMTWGITDLASGWRYKRDGIIFVCVIALLYMGIAHLQVQTWRNSLTLYRHAIRVTSDNYTAYLNLGKTLLQDKKIVQAMYYFDKAIHISSGHVKKHKAHNNIAIAWVDKGNLKKAMYHFKEAIRIDPSYADPYYNIGLMLCGQGMYKEAIKYVEKSLELKPNFSDSRILMGYIQSRL